MSDNLPFLAEYAKSGRAGCKLCKNNIGQATLRLAKMVQSPHFDGKVPNWFHFKCFFIKNKAKTPNQISGFDSLRWDDQQRIKEKLPGAYASSPSSKAKAPPTVTIVDSVDGDTEESEYGTDYAKSGRSKCKSCELKIEKGEVRVFKMADPDAGARYGRVPNWYHPACFANCKMQLDALTLHADNLSGLATLTPDDQQHLKTVLQLNSGKKAKPVKTKQTPSKSAPAVGQGSQEEMELKNQSQELWKIRDELNRNCSLPVLRNMLAENEQSCRGGETELLDRCADGMMFGALACCPECKTGHLHYKSNGYCCRGQATAWTPCLYTTKTPIRHAWIIPEEYHDISFLSDFKSQVRERIFPASINPKDLPLSGKVVLLLGKMKSTQAELSGAIKQLGGTVMSTPSWKVFVCISSPADVTKCNAKMKQIQMLNIPVVNEHYLDAVQSGDAKQLLEKHMISSWGLGRDVPDGALELPTKRSQPLFSMAGPSKKTKLTVKGGAVVDPDSALEDTCHVLQQNGNIFNAVLGQVDLTRGTNSYYKLQVLQYDSEKGYELFRSWGRVGTTIGGNKLQHFGRKEDAVNAFIDVYAEKTGSCWSDRNDFVKVAGRFYPLDIDYGQDDEDFSTEIEQGTESKLAKPVQEIVKMIFDVETMKKAMKEFEIDLKKMPLGKLSKRQLDSAYCVLGELQKTLESGAAHTKILDGSNRFYTLIPHDFGLRVPPLLDTMAVLKAKTHMLDNLMDIEIAYSLLKKGKEQQDKDPIDTHYESLKADIEVLPKSTKEFGMIKDYVQNTHAKTHSNYKLDVVEVFKLERDGETQRYKPFQQLPNRKLLWHGSRVTNYAGILSQGLRIAPPEAPVTGYMFGKGVYFADMVSKSANYCNTSPANSTGLMLLCEVALGNMYELTNAKSIAKLPEGKHSCKGCGRTAPDPKGDVALDDGVVIPSGKGVTTTVMNSSLLYNEYIVYDVSQIRMKYLLRLKFDHKSLW